MRVRTLSASGVRNLKTFEVDVDEPWVVVTGANAQGKTNLLELVWVLATLKPLRGTRLADVVTWGEPQARLQARVKADGGELRLHVGLGPSGRTLHLDGNPVHEVAEWTGLRAVAFTPDDVVIGSGEPALRRAWLDRAAFTAAPAHLDIVRRYRRVVAQKAAELRNSAQAAVLDALDETLVGLGTELVARRRRLLDELEPHLDLLHRELAGSGRLSLRYQTEVDLAAAVASSRGDELRRRGVLKGPHTDDVEFRIDDRPVRTWGSRGQLRSVVLSLKLEELVAAKARGQAPVFLLDDVGSELDSERTERLLDLLGKNGGQVFVSSTRVDLFDRLPFGTRRLQVTNGVLSVDLHTDSR